MEDKKTFMQMSQISGVNAVIYHLFSLVKEAK